MTTYFDPMPLPGKAKQRKRKDTPSIAPFQSGELGQFVMNAHIDALIDKQNGRRKVSYGDLVSARKLSSGKVKSESVMETLDLDSKGMVDLSDQSDCSNNNTDTNQRRNSPKPIFYPVNQSVNQCLKQRRNNKCQSYEPSQLLEQAIRENYLELVVKLINSGQVNINKLNSDGYCPIHQAAFEDRVELISALLDCGAFVDQRDISGLTALEIAVGEGCFESAKLLAERGADQKFVMNGNRIYK